MNQGLVVVEENGDPFLAVDGNCNYWAYNNSWLGVRTGTLTAEEAQTLTANAQLSSWSNWAGTYSSGGCDTGTRKFEFAGAEIVMQGGDCGSADSLPFPGGVLAAVIAEATSLSVAAPEITGGVRALVFPAVSSNSPPNIPNVAWPLTLDPASIALPPNDPELNEPGHGALVPGASDGAALRAIRDDYMAGKYGTQYAGHGTSPTLYVTGPDGTKYHLFFRDILPFEDSTGLVHVFSDN